MNEQILFAVVTDDMRDDVIDALICLPEISGFNLQTIDGYSREHGQYDLKEQVSGYRTLCKVEVIHTKAQEASLLDALQSACGGNSVRYWIAPLLALGHLPHSN